MQFEPMSDRRFIRIRGDDDSFSVGLKTFGVAVERSNVEIVPVLVVPFECECRTSAWRKFSLGRKNRSGRKIFATLLRDQHAEDSSSRRVEKFVFQRASLRIDLPNGEEMVFVAIDRQKAQIFLRVGQPAVRSGTLNHVDAVGNLLTFAKSCQNDGIIRRRQVEC